MQGFVVVPLFAGYDERRDRGRVFTYDVTGGRYEEADYQANGSGGVHARNWIKAGWREGMTEDETVELALMSMFAAADEDVATGGPDLVRRIFPTVAVIDANGFRSISDDEVAERSQTPVVGTGAMGAELHEHAVLRLARAGDEGPRRLRAKGIARGRSLVALECQPGS